MLKSKNMLSLIDNYHALARTNQHLSKMCQIPGIHSIDAVVEVN